MRHPGDGSGLGAGMIFLTWTPHRRTTGLGEQLSVPVIEITTPHRALPRYLVLGTRTLAWLVRTRPRVVVAQSPSIVLAALLVLLRPWFRYWLVVDAHNEAVRPYIHDSAPIRWLTKFSLRRADLTIVTNEELSRDVARAGGRAFVLPDPLPRPPPASEERPHTRPYVVVVSTFAPDEPLPEILQAAASIPDLDFLVTGNASLCSPTAREAAPANAVFTGFLSEDDYWTVLRHSRAIIDLTTMPDCLVCGAYEALAVGRPMLLTDSPAGRRLFSRTAVFVHNTVPDIAAGIRTIISSPVSSLPGEIDSYTQMWTSSRNALMALLGNPPPGRT